MNNKVLNDKQLYELVDKELSILEKNHSYIVKDKLSYEEQFEIFKDLYKLFDSFSLKDNTIKFVGNVVIRRYIPLLDLIVKLDNNNDHLIEYEKHLKNAYKLGARISLEHYMIYREWDDQYKEKFFAPRYEIMNGYIHYLQELECNPDFTSLVFNAPSGYGKTFPARLSEAWGFGIDDKGTFLSICSNDSVVKSGSSLVKEEMQRDYFGEVFPKLKYDKEQKDYFLKDTEGEWKLKNCKLPLSYLTSTSDSNTVGTRASKRISIDDLYPDYKEAMKSNLNDYYLNKYKTVWRKRFVQNKKPKILITGTMWASGDFIDLVINEYKKEYNFIKHPKYKYVWINIDDVKDLGKETIAIIQVPALDYETDESTCKELKATEELKKERISMPEYLWETNFQQLPTDPEALIFSYDKIRTYSRLPMTEFYGSYSYIDGTRKSGKDNFSMPIFIKVQNGNCYDYYFKDCLFTKTATSAMYDEIIKKIEENHITELVLESNVSAELKKNIDDRLKLKGINWCQVGENYERANKEARIIDNSYKIQNILVFPQKGMYGANSAINRFMDNLTRYNSMCRNENDDAPDSCSGFIDNIVEEKFRPQKAVPLANIRKYM